MMIKQISIFSCLLLLISFSSCRKEKVVSKITYNQKANEVIKQFILDESCGCILEIPKESMISEIIKDNPQRDVRGQIIEKLHLRDRMELDSLEKLSENFILDPVFLKQHKIIVVPTDSLRILTKNPNFCQKGILCVRKPIFNKTYKKAVVDYGYAFICLGYLWEIYKFENGKWKR